MSCIDTCIQAIIRTPQMHAIYYETYCRGLARRFSYVVFYEYTEDTVTVYRVFHTSVNPKKWRERLP